MWLLPFAAAAVLALAAAAYGATAHSAAAPTLVVDNSFTIKTSDPQRAFDPTASIVDRALYDTLFTYKGGDLAHPIPLLVSSWKATGNAKTFTFQLKRNVHFADGTPLTSADVVFSLNRLGQPQGQSGLPARRRHRLGGRQVHGRDAVDDAGHPAAGDPREPVDGHRQLDARQDERRHRPADAATADKAENWLNSSASAGAGSGPYVLKSYSTTSQITLTPNTSYWGTKKATFSSVVVRNMIATTQLINVQRGSHEIAIDLSSDQASGLKGNKKLKVSLQPSTWMFWLFANNDPKVSSITSNKQFQKAVRYGLDYTSIVSVAGKGAIQAPGVIPSMFLGSLPQSAAVKQDVAKAKAALAASGAGSQKVTLSTRAT